jgi:hypothetical protein
VVTNGVECLKGVNLGTAGTGNSVLPLNYTFQVFSPRMRGQSGNLGKGGYIWVQQVKLDPAIVGNASFSGNLMVKTGLFYSCEFSFGETWT